MRTFMICLVTALPTVTMANPDTCAEAPFCKHGVVEQVQSYEQPAAVNGAVVDLKDAAADIQSEPDLEAHVSEQITD